MAILVDLDSFTGRATVNVAAIERAAAAVGRPIVRYSFATPTPIDQAQPRHEFVARHYRHEELASRDALRLRLAMEALNIIGTTKIRDVIIVSSDEGFGFVSSLLMRQEARVMGIGVRKFAETTPEFIKAFDSFRFYDEIDRPPVSEDIQKLKKLYAGHLVHAALSLETRGFKPVGAALTPIIRDRHPEVSLPLAGLRNWRELAETARELGLVSKIEPSGVDFLVNLSDKGRAQAEAQLQVSETKLTRLGEIDDTRNAITKIFGADVPEASARFLVFNTTQWLLNEEVPQDGVSLVDLSYRVMARLGPTSRIEQNTVYRLLNGLHQCGIFESLPNPDNRHDPRIVRARIPVLNFDDAFVLNLMRVRKTFPLNSTPEDISSVLYGSPAQKVKVASLLSWASDPQFDRASLPGRLAKMGANPM